jgi:Rab-GTPase-TBC domain
MNFLAGGLLVFCTEETAFWMLTFIVDEMLHEYYSESMTGSIADWY